MTPAEALAWREAVVRKPAEHGVCACGHGRGAHTEAVPLHKSSKHDAYRVKGESVCLPSRYACPCPAYQEVLTTADTRLFTYKTTGPEEDHALSKGIKAAVARRLWVQWSPDLACANVNNCGNFQATAGMVLYPVAFDEKFDEHNGPTDYNKMVCGPCRHWVMLNWAADPSFVRPIRNEKLWYGK